MQRSIFLSGLHYEVTQRATEGRFRKPCKLSQENSNFAAQLNVNFNQIGNHILPSNCYTFHDRGAEQVDIVAKDEKHAYTLLVASTADGDFLPFQQVWSGASDRSIPSHNAPRMQDAIDCGFDFTFVKSDKKTSHFSTLKTMKEVGFYHRIFHAHLPI
jgi:hypothetical protein